MISRARVRVGMLLLATTLAAACGSAGDSADLQEVKRVRSGGIDVVLLSADGTIRRSGEPFVIEFLSADGELIDVGSVTVGATMPMGGMAPMVGTIELQPTDVRGRYAATADLSMVGDWRIALEWTGPAGQGSATLSTSVQ